MTWLTWRQHRGQIIAIGVAVALVALAMLPVGLSMHSTFNNGGLASCLATQQDCTALSNQFLNQYSLSFLIPLFLVVPVLAGLFVGAPLVSREVELGTYRLAWTQSVSRGRWMLVKLSVLGAVVLAGSAALALFLEWWSAPLVTAANDRFDPGVFDLTGITPVAYAIFAFAVGVVAGTVMRRSFAAAGLSTVVYVAIRAAVLFGARPHYLPARTVSYALSDHAPIALAGAWQTSAQTLDNTGRVVSTGIGIQFDMVNQSCPNLASPTNGSLPDGSAMAECIKHAGIHVVSVYQPADRYWLFQGIETALFLSLSVALMAFSVWWVRSRLA